LSADGQGTRRASRWTPVLALLLAGVLLFLAVRGVNWRDLLETLRHTRLEFLALMFCVGSASSFLRGLRWRVLLSAEKPIAPVTAFWATMVGYLGNNFLPARAGEIIRSVAIGQVAGISTSFVLATALTERMIDAVVLVLIGLATLLSLEGLPQVLLDLLRVIGMVAFAGLIGLFIAPRLEGLITRILNGLPLSATLRARLTGIVGQFLLGMRALQNVRRALSFAGLTAVIWLVDALGATIVARAMNLTLALPQAFLLLAALGLSSAAPSTPGYVGIYQFVAVNVLALFGFSNSEALAYIIVLQAMTYVSVTIWGSMGAWRLGVKWKR
jgi:uncharacterized protein (TIRG00374 family)